MRAVFLIAAHALTCALVSIKGPLKVLSPFILLDMSKFKSF